MATCPDLAKGGFRRGRPAAAYQLIAGLAGEAPLITRSADHPFRQEFRLLDDPFTVRMESWLPSDTFRRAGFGHVIRGREHVLILERGVNFVSFDRNARPSAPLYAASLYAPGERYRISSVSPSLARGLQTQSNLRCSQVRLKSRPAIVGLSRCRSTIRCSRLRCARRSRRA